MKKLIALLIIIFCFAKLNAQVLTCPFDQAFEDSKASDSIFTQGRIARSVYLHNYNSNVVTVQSTNPLIIPVVVHVIHPNTLSVGQGINISYAQIKSQIDRMNADFANDTVYTALPSGQYAVNVGIQFCLATVPMGPIQWTDTLEPGVMRYAVNPSNTSALNQIYSQTYFNTVDTLLSLTHPNSSYFPFNSYLNIWTVNQVTDSAGATQFAGYSPKPIDNNPLCPLDGIVMNAHMFGDNTVGSNNFPVLNPQYNTGNICSHEVGHYLNLLHTFTGGCAGTSISTCQLSGDFICDTPPDTNQTGSCSITNSCSETYFTTGPANHDDMIENYMTWHDDNCINTFTYEQGVVMRNFLLTYRSSLIDNVNLSLTGVASPTGCLPPQLLAAIIAPTQICVNDTVNFSTPSGPGFTAVSWQWQFIGGSPSASTAQNPSVSWASSGQQLVILTAYDAFNDSIQDSVFVYVNPCAALASDQGQWYFGRYAGIDFSSGIATNDNTLWLQNTMHVIEGCVTVSDTNGSLIFYSDGLTVWDKNHVPAITGLDGDTLGSKAQIIAVPHPLHDNWWYLFHGPEHVWTPGPIYYSIIADSNGTMIPIVLNDTLPRPLGCSAVNEGITAVPHCNGRDFWVITRAKGPPSVWSSTLLVYLISPAGITNPSGFGNLPATFVMPSGASAILGSIKASPDNTKIAVTSANTTAISVLDFNNSNGVLSNERTISSPVNTWYYGISFSPDSKVLYFGNLNSPQISAATITPTALNDTVVAALGSALTVGSMQLGPDSSLYVVGLFNGYVASFSNPNNISSPGFNALAVNLSATYGQISNEFGLPNMIDGIPPSPAPLSSNVVFQNCSTIVFSTVGCWGSSYNYSWDFGDGSPLDTNASGTHVYSTSGNYVVTLTLSVGNFSFPPIQQLISIFLTAPAISGPVTVCQNQIGFASYSTTSGAQTYQWSVTGGGAIQGADTLSTCNVAWSGSGTISCIVTNGLSCSFTTTLTVSLNASPVADAGVDTAYTCANSSYPLGGSPTASGGTGPYSYQWFPATIVVPANGSNPVGTITTATTFTVQVTDANGCVGSDIIFIGIDSTISAPTISFQPNLQSCDNATSFNLSGTASPTGGTFSGIGVTGNLFNPNVVTAPDSNTIFYLYTDANGCSAYDSTDIFVYNCCTPVAGINTVNGQSSSSFGSQFNTTPVPVRINGTFYINNTFFITGYNGTNSIRCAPNAAIVVKPGARLVIQSGSLLLACDDMWNGITIEPGGQLEILTNSMVRDAKQAVVSQNGAKFTLDQAVLRDNYQNIIVEPFTGQGLHPGTIVRSRVIGSVLNLAPYAGINTFSGMEIRSVDSIYVGIPTTTFDENEFRGMDIGIITTSANVFVRNNQFRNILSNQVIALPGCCATGGCGPTVNCNPPPKGTAIWSTGGNVVIGGGTISYENRFNTCTRGILAEYGINATIKNNRFQSINASNLLIPTYCAQVRFCKSNSEVITDNVITGCKNGILFGFSSLTIAVIETNSINNLTGTGIQVTQTTQCPVSIGFNSINATASANGKYGIRVSNAIVTNNIQYVEIHGNITKKLEKHIWVTNFPFIAIDNSNNMQFANGVPTTAQFGIQVQNCHNAYVDGNSVVKNGAIPTDTNYRRRLYGISMETNCYNTQVSNNGLFKVGTGIQYFNSNNFPSTISCNSMFNNMFGVMLNNTFVGNQGSPISATFPNGIAQDNIWTIQNSQAGNYKAIVRGSSSPTGTIWYYRNSTGGYLPTLSQVQPMFFVTFSGPLTTAPSLCVQPCPTCLIQANLSSVAARQSPFDTLSYTPMFLSDQSVYAQLRANQSLMAMGTQYDTTLSNFYNQNVVDNVGYVDEAYLKASQGDTTGAALAKDGIIPRGDPDLNHKLVLEIYLRTWARNQLYFTPQDTAVLYAIATQNVTYGGTAVYDARVMLDLDIDDIGFGSAVRLSDNNETQTVQGELYPNPTTGTTTYYTELAEGESGIIEVADVFGRVVRTVVLHPGENQAEINMAELSSGIYMYRAIINEEVRQTGKIIVEK